MITKIAMLPRVQKLISKTSNPKFYEKLNNTLPMAETIIASSAYAASIQMSNGIDKDRKPAMQYQNLICGTSGIILSSGINKFISKHKNRLCEELARRNIPKVDNIIKGVQVALPLLIFSSLLRYVIPVVSVPISTRLEQLRKDKYDKKIIKN